MRAIETWFVFNYKQYVVIVDSLGIFTGILDSSNSTNTQNVMLLDIKNYMLKDVLYVHDF